MKKIFYYCIPLFCLFVTKAAKEKLSYNKDIRPILSDRCFACHGQMAVNLEKNGKAVCVSTLRMVPWLI